MYTNDALLRKLCFFVFLLFPFSVALADDTTPYRNNRCMVASINSNKQSVYPTNDSEYSAAIGKILVSWRMLPTDSYETAFDLYRHPQGKSRTKVSGTSGIIASTCFQDSYTDFSRDITYELTLKGSSDVIASYTITSEQLQAGVPYVSVPLQNWEGTPDGFIYKVNDCSYGDLDGDGEPEIVVKRGARVDSLLMVNGGLSDEDRKEIRHTVMWEAYKLDGTLLWRVLSGPNIETGNSSSFAVYDFDGDGRCEVATRLSEGAIFGDGAEIGDVNGDGKTDYRTFTSTHIHGAPEFLCVIDGQTGRELARADYIPTGGSSEAWGDDYWKRAGSIRVGAIRCAKDTTSILIARGVYARTVVEAWDYANGNLSRRWRFDSNAYGCANYAGQGYHSLFVGDVDDDGLDEMCYGSMTLDHDGSPLYVSGSKDGKETVLYGKTVDKDFKGYGHGDALHMGDFVPSRPGLEIFSCFETGEYGAALRDARTGETIWAIKDKSDVGRCSVADIFPEYPGCEMWWYKGNIMTADGKEITTDAGKAIAPPADNMAVWFSGSLNRQLLDGTKVTTKVASTGKERRALRANFFNAKAINGTKNNPCLYADLFGDWREEIIYVDSAETQLKIFSTWYPTDYRFPCLLTDHLYELSAVNQNIGYNQPTETGRYLGSDLLTTVTFEEANGLNPSVTVYRDSLYKSKVGNGDLIPGRTYYLRAYKYGHGYYRAPFTFTADDTVVRFDMDAGTTAIHAPEVTPQSSDTPVYNLCGQRVGKMVRGNVYIVGGKKVVCHQ